MKRHLNEAKRMQQLAGINETEANISTPFYFKSNDGIQGIDKDAVFLIKDIPDYGNVKVYYYDGLLERFFWMYKDHLQNHINNKDYFEVSKDEYEPKNEKIKEMFVGPRRYTTYMPDEWNYELLVKLFDDLYGIDITDEIEGGNISLEDLKGLLNHYGATNFQRTTVDNKPILPMLVKMLTDKGHNVANENVKEADDQTQPTQGVDQSSTGSTNKITTASALAKQLMNIQKLLNQNKVKLSTAEIQQTSQLLQNIISKSNGQAETGADLRKINAYTNNLINKKK